MNIYKLSFNYLDYLNLDINKKKLMLSVGKGIGGSKAFMSYGWDNLSLKDAWIDIGASFVEVEGLSLSKRPDITTWNGANFVLSPKAYGLLEQTLRKYGEFLPITIDDEEYQVFNCLNVVHADKEKSESDIVDGLWMGVKSIGFKDEDIKSNLIFKSRFDRCGSIYCGDEFKQLIEELKLEGLLFLKDLVKGL